MAGRTYLLARRAPPGRLKRAVDRVLLPASIDWLYRGEMLAHALAVRTQRSPATALLAAVGCGYALRAMRRR